eukprot:g2291.t1
MIGNGEAHLMTAESADTQWAHAHFYIEPLLYENYGAEYGTEYHAVAVVPKSFCDANTTLNDLRGLRSCHTGYRKTAGWYMPLGALLSTGLVNDTNEHDDVEDDAETMKSFFGEMCAPRVSGSGPKLSPKNISEPWSELCTICDGDCTTHDKYYEYEGALRCLMEGAGDVAFVKDATLLDFARDGADPRDWADKDIADFQLVCLQGGCKNPEEYKDCHLARVPAHSVLTNASMAFGGSDFEFGQKIQNALVEAVENNSEFLDSVIEMNGQRNFLFKAGTKALDPVMTPFEGSVENATLLAYRSVISLLRNE